MEALSRRSRGGGRLMINDPPLLATPREVLGSAVPRAFAGWNLERRVCWFRGLANKCPPCQTAAHPRLLPCRGRHCRYNYRSEGVPRITLIEQWTSAFLVFASKYAEKHIVRVLEMFKYMDTVRTAARFGGFGWRTYDAQFRLRQAREPTRSWAVIDSELWLMTATAPCTHSTPAYYGDASRESDPFGQTN